MLRTTALVTTAFVLALTGCTSDETPEASGESVASEAPGGAETPTATATEPAVDPAYVTDKQIRVYLEARHMGEVQPHQVNRVAERVTAPGSNARRGFPGAALTAYLYMAYEPGAGERTVTVADGTATTCQDYNGKEYCGTFTDFVGIDGLVAEYKYQGWEAKKATPADASKDVSATAVPAPGVGSVTLDSTDSADGDLWVVFTVKNTSGKVIRFHSPTYVVKGRQVPAAGNGYILGPTDLMPGVSSPYLLKFDGVPHGGQVTLTAYDGDGYDVGPMSFPIPKL